MTDRRGGGHFPDEMPSTAEKGGHGAVADEYEGRLFIDGEFREASSGARFEVINPADESVVGTAADGGIDDVTSAVSAARRAADETSWATDHEFRERCLRQLQE